jgi:tetrahydromethanopterin S-methyltransferase subunit B
MDDRVDQVVEQLEKLESHQERSAAPSAQPVDSSEGQSQRNKVCGILVAGAIAVAILWGLLKLIF